MGHARGVGVGQLIDQRQLRPSRQDSVQVHLLQHRAAVLEPQPGNVLQAGQ